MRKSITSLAAAPKPFKAKEADIGGLTVRRLVPQLGCKHIGPWVFFDHMGPTVKLPELEGVESNRAPSATSSSAHQAMDVRPHPHINLATVTYMFEGAIEHRDSVGSRCIIKPGDINLMVAGKGIVHSEREPKEARLQSRNLHGLQLWHALPEADEECEPSFHHYPSNEIPTFSLDDCSSGGGGGEACSSGVSGRVLIGSMFGKTSPVRTFSRTIYLEATLEDVHSSALTIPRSLVGGVEDELGVYVASGQVEVEGTADCQSISQYELMRFGEGGKEGTTARRTVAAAEGGTVPAEGEEEIIETITLRATKPNTTIAVVGGTPLGQRHISWNFVSSRKERVDQALRAWADDPLKNFPVIPGDDKEFVPLPQHLVERL